MPCLDCPVHFAQAALCALLRLPWGAFSPAERSTACYSTLILYFLLSHQVAETRQLKEDEEVLMWRAVSAMQQLYSEIMQVTQAP